MKTNDAFIQETSEAINDLINNSLKNGSLERFGEIYNKYAKGVPASDYIDEIIDLAYLTIKRRCKANKIKLMAKPASSMTNEKINKLIEDAQAELEAEHITQ